MIDRARSRSGFGPMRRDSLVSSSMAETSREIRKMEKMLQRNWGKKITLSLVIDADLISVRAANVNKRNKNCVKNTILANLEGIHIFLQPFLWSLANSLFSKK